MLDDKSDIRINEIFRQFRLGCMEDDGDAQIDCMSLSANEDGDGNKSIQLAIVAHIKSPDDSTLIDQFVADYSSSPV